MTDDELATVDPMADAPLSLHGRRMYQAGVDAALALPPVLKPFQAKWLTGLVERERKKKSGHVTYWAAHSDIVKREKAAEQVRQMDDIITRLASLSASKEPTNG